MPAEVEIELMNLASALETDGYALTSFESLGLRLDRELVRRLCEEASQAQFSSAAAELTKHIEKHSMTMIQDDNVLALGRSFVLPVVERLFAESPRARQDWQLYALNRYETGGTLGAHQDSVGSTVLVVTASGERKFDVYKNETEREVFREIERTFILQAGSIMILDAQADVGHGVSCVEGPSVAAVLDVPDMLRP